MTEKHPITPPSELIEEWVELSRPTPSSNSNSNVLATYAARWGADQELKACCTWLFLDWVDPVTVDHLCAYRRPKTTEAD